MATEEQAAATTARWRAAVEAGDADAWAQTLAPDVVLNSPITTSTTFNGVEDCKELLRHVLQVIDGIAFTDDVGDATTRALFYTASVRGVQVEEATRVRLDDQARVTEITLWFRPLPGLTALMAALGPRLARRNGRSKAAATALMTRPLAAMTKSGDKVAVRLIE
jgi:hypothetical protein